MQLLSSSQVASDGIFPLSSNHVPLYPGSVGMQLRGGEPKNSISIFFSHSKQKAAREAVMLKEMFLNAKVWGELGSLLWHLNGQYLNTCIPCLFVFF